MTPTQLTELITQYLLDSLADFNGDIDALAAGLASRISDRLPYVLDDPITITAEDAELVEKARKAVEQMQPELKAALKRLRTSNYPSDESGGIRYELDKICIAKAYLAEHPADEDEPASKQWCEQLLGRNAVGRRYVGDKWLPEIGCSGHRGFQWIAVPHCATRRQVRQLCEALGVPMGESHDR